LNEEVHALVYFARNFGAKARVAARFDRENWYFFHPDDLHKTDGHNYRVKKETALTDGTPFDDLADDAEKAAIDEVAVADDPDTDVLRAVSRGDLSVEEAVEML